MPYCQLFYHFVWTTRAREPLLTPERELLVYDFIRSKAIGLGGIVYALNGTEDHVHLVASIPPRLAVADFIGQVKGVASARFNKTMSVPPLYWQAEYGVFTFDGKRLKNVIEYVEKQKEHHKTRDIIPILERTEDHHVGSTGIREPSPTYDIGVVDNHWWQEMVSLG